MREGQPSHTAAWVSWLRGVATLGPSPVARDPYAKALLPPLYAAPLHALGAVPAVGRAVVGAADFLGRGRVRYLELRTAAIDAAAQAHRAARGGPLVLLGAGLDARAHRLAPSSPVVEIDHPATQIAKRARLRAAGIDDGHVRYAACDFARDRLEDVLSPALAGLAGPPVVVWEGVTMYLPPAAVDGTLAALAAVLPPGATLAVTYFAAPARASLRALVAALGEPFAFAEPPAPFAARLRRFGFTVTEDSGAARWAQRFLTRSRAPNVGFEERLAVAVRG